MGDFEPGDKEIVIACLDMVYHDMVKFWQRSADWALPSRPKTSEELAAFWKRVGQLVLILSGRGDEIKGAPPSTDDGNF